MPRVPKPFVERKIPLRHCREATLKRITGDEPPIGELKVERKKVPKEIDMNKGKSHPAYFQMIKRAIKEDQTRKGTTRQAIEKYIFSNYSMSGNWRPRYAFALKKLLTSGKLISPYPMRFKLSPSEVKKLKKKPKKTPKSPSKEKTKKSPSKTKKSTTPTKGKSTRTKKSDSKSPSKEKTKKSPSKTKKSTLPTKGKSTRAKKSDTKEKTARTKKSDTKGKTTKSSTKELRKTKKTTSEKSITKKSSARARNPSLVAKTVRPTKKPTTRATAAKPTTRATAAKPTTRGVAKKHDATSEKSSKGSGELIWVWQYYDNGFHNYQTDANDVVESVYQEYLKSPYTCDVRSVKSGQWMYEIDFRVMTQKNIRHESHTERKIRRFQIPSSEKTNYDKNYGGSDKS